MTRGLHPITGRRNAAGLQDVAAICRGCPGRAGCARHGRKAGIGKD
jgi:hypothetical protein